MQEIYNTCKWSATSWGPDGTLIGGLAEPGFSDVIQGTAGNDKIAGLGGNDAPDNFAINSIAAYACSAWAEGRFHYGNRSSKSLKFIRSDYLCRAGTTDVLARAVNNTNWRVSA
ncbi:MAG: hypothetical protein KAY82_05975 [Hylemonella sp.]|nr:hypothetical protein [Hylemonella sp.]